MASFWNNKFVAGYLNGTHTIDLSADVINIMLCNTTYSPDQVADEFIDDGEADDAEAGETGADQYTRKTLSGKSITPEQPGADQVKFDATDPTVWESIGGNTPDANVQYAPIYHHAGSADTANRQILNLDFGSTQNLNGIDFTVQFSANGIGYAECL